MAQRVYFCGMEMSSLIPLFFAALVLMIKPGPYMMTFVSLSLEGRWKSMLAFYLGYNATNTIAYFVLLSTLTLLPAGTGIVFLFIKGLAAFMFVSMGIGALKESIGQYEVAAEQSKERLTALDFGKTFLTGSLLCVSNPLDLLFTMTMIPALLNTTDFALLDIVFIRGTVMLADILILVVYCLPLFFIRKFLGKNTLRHIKTVSALALIMIGIYVFSTLFTRGDLTASNLIS